MRSKEEIRKMLEINERIKEKASVFSCEFTLASGEVMALEWVLKDSED